MQSIFTNKPQNKFQYNSSTSIQGKPLQKQNVQKAYAMDQPINFLRQITSLGRKEGDLQEGIGNFYNSSSSLWERIWGEHMHHGYYYKNQENKSNQETQVDMIEEALKFAQVENPKQVLDVGCGIGGSSRYIASKYNCNTVGITLSSKQAERANQLSKIRGLGEKCTFQVADAMKQPFPDNSFDFVWSMESGEHMPNKPDFIKELHRVCKPNGRIVVITWCHRDLNTPDRGYQPLTTSEQSLLDRLCEAFYLPQWCSRQDYQKIFDDLKFKDVRTDDWTEQVKPFWLEVIKTALSFEGFSGLITSNLDTIKGAIVMPLMALGMNQGTVKFIALAGKK